MNSPSDEFAMKLRNLCLETPPDYTAPEMTARLVDIARNQLAFTRDVVVAEIHRQWDLHDAFGGGISPVYVPVEEGGAVEPDAVFSSDCMSAMAHFLECATAHVETNSP